MAAPHPALIELAAGRLLPDVNDVDSLVRSACEHKMVGLLWEEVKAGRFEAPKRLDFQLAKRALRVKAHHRKLWDSLERVVRNLRQNNLEVAVLKGVVAESRWYPELGTRPSQDVDVLLRPSDIPSAGEAIATIEPDHQLIGSIASLATQGDLQSVDLRDDRSTDFDLHFDALKIEVPLLLNRCIWDRTVLVKSPSGVPIRSLDPEVSLILFLIHLTKDRFAYLLGFTDVVRLIERENIDWRFIDQLTKAEGIDIHFYSALEAVYETLRLKVPPHNRPYGWRAAAWQRLWPPSSRLQGDVGRASHHRRQFWIGLLAKGRSLEASRRWIRRVFPREELLDYHFPETDGPYPYRLAKGRVSARRKRREDLKTYL